MKRATGTVDALGLVGPLTRCSAHKCVVFTEGPGRWRPLLLTAVSALETVSRVENACIGQQTADDDGKTAQLRCSWAGTQEIMRSQRRRESNWKLSGSLRSIG